MTELAVYEPQNTLPAQMEYAKAISVASMLPESYRGKPADIMLAMGLGQSMGLSPAEALYRINVIKGKPCASAELIAANVRKAGHRLRVMTDEQTKSVKAVIIRADDPEFQFEVTRDEAWARSMGLAGQGNYAKQLLTMLQWRAITACARLACPDALYGVAYTVDELQDDAPRVVAEPASGASRMGAILGTQTSEAAPGVGAPAEPDPPSEGENAVSESPLLNTRSSLAKRMFASLAEAGVEEADRLTFCSATIGRTVESSKEMTDSNAERVIEACRNLMAMEADPDVAANDPALDGA